MDSECLRSSPETAFSFWQWQVAGLFLIVLLAGIGIAAVIHTIQRAVRWITDFLHSPKWSMMWHILLSSPQDDGHPHRAQERMRDDNDLLRNQPQRHFEVGRHDGWHGIAGQELRHRGHLPSPYNPSIETLSTHPSELSESEEETTSGQLQHQMRNLLEKVNTLEDKVQEMVHSLQDYQETAMASLHHVQKSHTEVVVRHAADTLQTNILKVLKKEMRKQRKVLEELKGDEAEETLEREEAQKHEVDESEPPISKPGSRIKNNRNSLEML